jgi:hypothetical protein
MKYLTLTIALFSLSFHLNAQVTEQRKSMIEGFISGCKKHNDTKIILEHFKILLKYFNENNFLNFLKF